MKLPLLLLLWTFVNGQLRTEDEWNALGAAELNIASRYVRCEIDMETAVNEGIALQREYLSKTIKEFVATRPCDGKEDDKSALFDLKKLLIHDQSLQHKADKFYGDIVSCAIQGENEAEKALFDLARDDYATWFNTLGGKLECKMSRS